jgi:hypothetical protein
MARAVTGSVLIVLLAFGTACRTRPVYDVAASPLPIGSSLDLDAVASAIQRAGASLGWSITPEGPGQMTGTLQVRQHVAVVDISYDTKSFGIRYKDSTNLMYRDGEIHRNYNRWVKRLEERIREELFVPGS